MKILLVEDNPDTIFLIKENIKNFLTKEISEDIEFEFIKDGNELINKVSIFNPDIILLDILMPGKDGFACLQDLKNHYLYSDIPVIIMSALNDYSYIKNALSNGAFDYITKPFTAIELVSKIKMAHRFNSNNKKLKEYETYANINESLLHAQRIQKSFFPDKEKRNRIFKKSEYLFLPKDFLSGDFLWLNESDGKKLMVIGDCTGHGIPAAMLTVMASTLLNKNLNYKKEFEPDKILSYLSYETDILLNSKDTYTLYDGLDGACIVYDNNILKYAGAHTPMYIVSKYDSLTVDNIQKKYCANENGYYLYTINADRISIGKESIQYDFTKHEIEINTGDRIYFTTDGYYEQLGLINGKSVKYGKKRLLNKILEVQKKSLGQQIKAFYEDYKFYMDKMPQMDDIFVLIIEF